MTIKRRASEPASQRELRHTGGSAADARHCIASAAHINLFINLDLEYSRLFKQHKMHRDTHQSLSRKQFEL